MSPRTAGYTVAVVGRRAAGDHNDGWVSVRLPGWGSSAPHRNVELPALRTCSPRSLQGWPGRRHRRGGLGDRPGVRPALSSISWVVPSQASPEGEIALCSPWALGNDEGWGRGPRARPIGPSAQARATARLLLDLEGTERTGTPAAPPPPHARRRCSTRSVRPLRTEATRDLTKDKSEGPSIGAGSSPRATKEEPTSCQTAGGKDGHARGPLGAWGPSDPLPGPRLAGLPPAESQGPVGVGTPPQRSALLPLRHSLVLCLRRPLQPHRAPGPHIPTRAASL